MFQALFLEQAVELHPLLVACYEANPTVLPALLRNGHSCNLLDDHTQNFTNTHKPG